MRDTKTLIDNLKEGIEKYKKETCEDLFAVTIPVVDIMPKLEKLIELERKEEPEEPYLEGDGYVDGKMVYDTWVCQNCGKKYELEYQKYERCPHCGQLIDWDIPELEDEDE